MSETQAPPEGPPPPASVAVSPREFRPLDARVVQLWRVTGMIGYGILLLVALAPLLSLGAVLLGGVARGLLSWTALALVCGGWAWWFPKRRHQAWGYRLDARVLETRSGVWFRVVKLLPLSRLQHVDLRRGPLERAHGLASLLLHTAGTHEATHIIPGLDADEAVRLRDLLVAAGGDDGV